MASFLAEWDGFQNRDGITLIGATNRRDLLDSALVSRFDTTLQILPPNRRGARAIFEIHLPADLPYGTADPGLRDEMIETALSMFYSPNGDNQLCTLRFRDSRTPRAVHACDLASGRLFAQICGAAAEEAFCPCRGRG